MTTPSFDTPNIAHALESMPSEAIDRLPFGVVRLSAKGGVTFYSKTEGRLSGYGDRPVLGRHFFDAIAPCMNTPSFRARIQEEKRRGTLDFEFGHTGDFDDPARFVRVRVCSASDGGYWLLLSR